LVYKRYFSPFDEPKRPITENAEIIKPIKIEEKEKQIKKTQHKKQNTSPFDFFGKIKNDDLIILGIIVVLLLEDKENRDISLILALGFLFLIEYIEAP